MKKNILCFLFTVSCWLSATGQPHVLPTSISSGKQGTLHVQGVAVDQIKGHVYFSFTDRLVKMDLSGKLIGSVTGFVGHLGDLDFGPDGKIYGSLEYKRDAIGKGVKNQTGGKEANEDGFYIAIFDVDRIVHPAMDAEAEDLLKTVYVKEAVLDYGAKMKNNGKVLVHRFGCSGIDGIAFAPAIGKNADSKKYLYVAYGIYGDTTRSDNDHQVILMYDVSDWKRYERPLSQQALHHSGPAKPLEKYFVKTGNTRYGIQNLAYDPYTGNLFAAVYRGAKSIFPNYDLFVIDRNKRSREWISDGEGKVRVDMLSLIKNDQNDGQPSGNGWFFKWGATGLHPLGNGLHYLSHPLKLKDGQQEATVHLYRWTGNNKEPFVLVR